MSQPATSSTVQMDRALERVETLAELLDRAVGLWADRPAITSVPDGRRVTFAQLHREVHRMGAVLEGAGVQAGDRVGAMMANRLDYPLVWLACARLGAVMVPINSNYQRSDAGYVINHSGCAVIVCDNERFGLLEDIRGDADALWKNINVDAFVTDDTPGIGINQPCTVVGETVLNIQYTSGTTGRPKGCLLSHTYWMTMARKNTLETPGLSEKDVLLTAQPFSYMDPQWNLASALAAGAELVILDRFHPSTFWPAVRDHGATFFYCLGIMPTLMAKTDPDPADREHQVRVVACSGIPPSLHRALEERFGVPWLETYGMTEIGNGAAMRLRDHDERVASGAIGRATSMRELRIVDDNDQPLPRGQVGQLVVRGPGMMDGYFQDPKATAEVFRNGWFHTGDRARIDRDGFLYFVGRTKDMIRRSGENISAAEVEEVIGAHPDVQLVACVAVADDLRGEEVKAYVVLRSPRADESALKEKELPEHTQRLLAYFKVPRYWEYRESLPLTPSAKVAKGQLVRGCSEPLTIWDRADGQWR